MDKRKTRLYLLSALCVLVVMIAIGETALRLISPTEYLHPRYKFSAQYGLSLFENSVMIHGVPGKYKFKYTVNNLGYRGEVAATGGNDGIPRVVVLGDSYAFGMGVNDGEEFPAVLNKSLGPGAGVLNLACPGWGLTQQIRRFYDFGLEYQPAAVVLQFCANDPEDNFVYRVTGIDDGEFVFQDSRHGLNWIKKYLSKSFVQRSQLYNFFRQRAYRMLEQRLVKKQVSQFMETDNEPGGLSSQELFYRDLLALFAAKLEELKLPLIMISVDRQLDEYPSIKEKVLELDAAGGFWYLEVTEWLEGMEDYQSVEGHVWGKKAHEVIGKQLGDYINREIFATLPPDARPTSESIE